MSKLDDLINKLCPDGVEYKSFGDVVRFINGRAYKQEELLQSGKYKVLRVGNFFTSDSWYYSDLELENEKYCNKGDLLYAWAASLGPKIWNGDKTIFHYHIWKLEFDEKVLSKKYLYHFLRFDVDKMYESLTHSTMPHVSMGSMQKREIPVPPLKIQNEIVRILDNFTELEEELEEELVARRKQYEYYRDSLLTFDDSVEWKTLGEITNKITDGMHNLPNCVQENTGYPIISAQNINNGIIDYITNKYVTEDIFKIENKRTLVAENDVLLTIVGAIGRSAVVKTDKKMLFQRSVCVIKPNGAIIDSSFLKYMFDSRKIQNYIQRNAQGAAQKGIYLDSVKKIKIPVPSLERQKQIAEILDRFDALTNDITSGLPAEIEARHKQYEYYRDKLLTFKRKEA